MNNFPWAFAGAVLILGLMVGAIWLQTNEPETFNSIVSHMPLYRTDWVD